MKKSILFLALTFISLTTFSQGIVPQDAKVIHDKISKPCLTAVVDPSTDELKDAWVEYLSKNHEVKLKGSGFMTNKDVLTAEKIVITAVSPKAMDLYTEIIEVEGRTSMKVFAAFGYDIYVNSTDFPTEYAAMKKIMSDFLSTYITNFHSEKVVFHQKEVNGFTKDKSKLDKSIAKDAKNIEKMTSKIEKMNESIEKNKVKLEETETLLKVQKEKLQFHTEKLNAL